MKEKNEQKESSNTKKVWNFISPFRGWSSVFVKPATTQAKEIHSTTKEIFSQINPIGAYERAKEKSRIESFQEACDRMNLTEEDLSRSLKFSIMMSRIALFFFFTCLLFGFHFLLAGKFSIGFPIIAFCFFHIAMQHKYSFRAYQIRKRKLGNHKEFLKDSHMWIQ